MTSIQIRFNEAEKQLAGLPITTDEGYEYKPFTAGHALGFHVTAPNGHRQVLFLNPCGADSDGAACTFVYQGDVDVDVDEITDEYLVGQVEASHFINLFDDDTTADALARCDLIGEGMASDNSELLPYEIELRAAEIAERRDLDKHGFANFPARGALFRSGIQTEATFINLDRVASWLHLYGVPAFTEQTGGGVAVLRVGDRTPGWDGEEHRPEYPVSLGSGWFEGPGWTNPYAVTGDFTITTNEMDPDKTIQIPAHITELECAWMAINLLTAAAPLLESDGGPWRVVKAKPVGPRIDPCGHCKRYVVLDKDGYLHRDTGEYPCADGYLA